MKNPNPIGRARRIEMRRKHLGYPTRCHYCGETDIFCFEEDHPVTEGLDPKFKRVVCRNCHRKEEGKRDVSGLTTNGQHFSPESPLQAHRRYLLLMAQDEESQAELLEREPNVPPALLIKASRDRAASLRRKAQALSLSDTVPAPTVSQSDPSAAAQSAD